MRIPKEYAEYRDGEFTELYYTDCCVREEVIPHQPDGPNIVDLENFPIVQKSFLLPYRLLASFNRGIDGNHVPVTRPAWLGTYDPAVDRTKLEPKELLEQDSALLSDFLVTGNYHLLPFRLFLSCHSLTFWQLVLSSTQHTLPIPMSL